MSSRPFTMESYSEDDRPEAWRDVLSSVGLQPTAATTVHRGHATALRRNAEGVTLLRLSAGPPAVSPLSRPPEAVSPGGGSGRHPADRDAADRRRRCAAYRRRPPDRLRGSSA